MPTTVHLVRHAEPDADDGLTDRGRDQVALLAQRLFGSSVEGIHHGPAARTTETARLLGAVLSGVPIDESRMLADLTPAPALGAEDTYPTRLREWVAQVPPAEQDAGGVRLSQAIQHFTRRGASSCAVLVTHAFVIGWFVRAALEAPPHRWMELFPDHASLTTIVYRQDGRAPEVIRFNDTGHLG